MARLHQDLQQLETQQMADPQMINQARKTLKEQIIKKEKKVKEALSSLFRANERMHSMILIKHDLIEFKQQYHLSV